MVAIVLQLQQEALDQKIPVSDLLLKALVISRKLGLHEFQEWVNNELSGYRGKDAPEYRDIKGEVRGLNPYTNHWMPLIFESPKEGESISHRKASQSIAELEHLVKTDGELHMPFSQAIQRKLSKSFGFETQVSLLCTTSGVIRIINAVRTIILNWTLKLEEEGILGEGLSFTPQEREVASKSSQNISNFNAPIQNLQIQQGNNKAAQFQVQVLPDPPNKQIVAVLYL